MGSFLNPCASMKGHLEWFLLKLTGCKLGIPHTGHAENHPKHPLPVASIDETDHHIL